MTSEASNSPADDMSSRVHNARHGLLPAAVIAGALTALHPYGLAFTLGAVASWLLLVTFSTFEAAHDWSTCSYCNYPPKRWATPEARAKTARKAHSRWRKRLSQAVFAAALASALLPKPYLSHWWGQLAAAVLYTAAGLTFFHQGILFGVQHKRYRDECHIERCRADQRPYRPVFVWTGHYGPGFLLVLVPVNCAIGLWALHHGTVYQITYSAVLVLTGFIMLCMVMDHLDLPCVRCARHLPVDAEEQADRKSRWLRAHHQLHYMLPCLALGAWIVSWTVAGTPAGRIMVAFAALLLLPWAVLIRVHGRLQPWCPWCRDGGGEHVDEGVPDPSQNQPAPV